MCHL
ncbi:unnamed protein product [Larinioides sclopetarius]|jgi:hypothetical protein